VVSFAFTRSCQNSVQFAKQAAGQNFQSGKTRVTRLSIIQTSRMGDSNYGELSTTQK